MKQMKNVNTIIAKADLEADLVLYTVFKVGMIQRVSDVAWIVKGVVKGKKNLTFHTHMSSGV